MVAILVLRNDLVLMVQMSLLWMISQLTVGYTEFDSSLKKTTPCTRLLKPENKEEGWNARARGREINLGDILAPF